MTARPARSFTRGALLVLGAATALGGVACGQDAASKPPAASRLYVDGVSVGGPCKDDRSVAQASSPKTPWCSLARAAQAAPAGRVVLVRRGSYAHVALTAIKRRGWVTLAPAPGERVLLTGGLAVQGSSYVRLRGFAIRSRDTASTVVASDHVEIADADVSGQGFIVRNSRHVTFAGNRIHDLIRTAGPDGFEGYGIWANGFETGAPGEQLADLTIRGNVFDRIPQDGIQIGGGPKLVSRVVIAGNRFDHVIRAQPNDHSDAIQVLGAAGITIAGNSIRQAEECLLVKDDITRGLVLENNVMIGSPSMGNCVQIYDAPGARIVNNTFWQQAEGWPQALIIGSAGAVAPVGTIVRNNIVNRYQVQDPSWVSQDHNLIVEGPHVGSHDSTRAPSFDAQWRLAPGSSGIDAGDSAGAPSRDRFGHRRRDDPAVANVGSGRLPYVDIGALER